MANRKQIKKTPEKTKDLDEQAVRRSLSDDPDIFEIPELTPHDIEDAINQHKDDALYPGQFRIGGVISSGRLSRVYRLIYCENAPASSISEEKNRLKRTKESYAVRVFDPIHEFLSLNKDYAENTFNKGLKALKKNDQFLSLLAQRDESLKRITQICAECSGTDHILRYYPGLSFETDVPVPMVTMIVMEEAVCTLMNLTDLAAMSGRIRRMFKVGLEIAQALRKCEETACVHRDINPVNIGIRFTGTAPDCYEYVLSDFESEYPAPDQTRQLYADFAAPETMHGEAALNDEQLLRADQYSLGAVLAYILHPQDWKEYRSELGDHNYIFSVINRCLQNEPENRFTDFQEIIDCLSEAKRLFNESSSENTVAQDDLSEIDSRYRKQLEEKDKELNTIRSDFERQLEEKDRVITERDKTIADKESAAAEQEKKLDNARKEFNKQLEQKNTDLEEAEKQLNELKEKLKKSADPEEMEKLKKSEKDLKKQLKDVKDSLSTISEELAAKTERNEALSKKVDEYKELFLPKKESSKENDKILYQITYKNGKSYRSLSYQYTYGRDGYTKILTTYLSDGTISSKYTYSYDKKDRLVMSVGPIPSLEGLRDIEDKTVNTYSSDGSCISREYEDGKLVREKKYSKTRQISETVYRSAADYTVYEFKYSPTRPGNHPAAIYRLKNGIRSVSPVYTYTYDCWPDGSLRRVEIQNKGDSELFSYKSSTETYTVSGLIESRTHIYTDFTSVSKYYYDDQGRCVHDDHFKDNELNWSCFYMYDSSGRNAETIYISKYTDYTSKYSDYTVEKFVPFYEN